MKSILITAAILLSIPAAAHADGPPIIPPVGAVVCSGSDCMTAQPMDRWTRQSARTINYAPPYDVWNGVVQQPWGGLQWGGSGCSSVNTPTGPFVGGACTIIPGVNATWRVQRFHRYRTSEDYYSAIIDRFYPTVNGLPVIAGRGADTLTYRPQFNTPDCNPTGDNAAWFELYPGLTGLGYIASSDAPEDFADACGLPSRDEAASIVAAHQREQEQRSYGPSGVDRACLGVRIGTSSAAVRSRGVYCGPSRDVLARFMRGAGSSRGFACRRWTATIRCSRPSGRVIIGRVRR